MLPGGRGIADAGDLTFIGWRLVLISIDGHLLSHSRNSFYKLNEVHIHVPRAVDLIDLGYHGEVKEWPDLSLSKILIDDSRSGNHVCEMIQSYYFRFARVVRFCVMVVDIQ